MKRKQIKSIVIISVIMIFWGFQLYHLYEDRQIVNLLNSFSRSTKCEISLSNGVKTLIEENEWENITEKGVGFIIDDKGKKTYKDQEMVNLMEVKLYNDNKILSKLQIKEIVSSDEILNILYNNATLPEPSPEPSLNAKQKKPRYYDEINNRKIIVIANKYYCTGLEEFLQPLFDYLNEKEYIY